MALVKGSNSYVTVLEADEYFSTRLDSTLWDEIDTTRKAQALVTATSILDSQSWTGTASTDSQLLAFPRSCVYFDPMLGITVVPTNVPVRIIKATCEQAFHLLNNSGLLDDSGGVTNLNVGSISLSSIRSPSLIPGVVRKLIEPLLINAGSTAWWRAN